MFDSPLFVRTRRVVEDNAWWIIILGSSLGGLTFLALSIYPFGEGGLVTRYVKPTDLQALLKSVGTAVLSGGVFAAILKALQFARIFQEELSIVIYDPKFLERRTDIETVWGEVSDILFELDVRYPDGIDMGFFSMGTPGEFRDRGSSKNRLWKSYKGLIFPQQGYRIALSRK